MITEEQIAWVEEEARAGGFIPRHIVKDLLDLIEHQKEVLDGINSDMGEAWEEGFSDGAEWDQESDEPLPNNPYYGPEPTESVEVWETDAGALIVFGTHDSDLAYIESKRWYKHNSEEPEGLAKALQQGFTKLWVNHHSPEIGNELWPEEIVSKVEVEGWTPFMTYMW